jgi:hypothetical protein
MLPDGAHLREDDCTFFLLNQTEQVSQLMGVMVRMLLILRLLVFQSNLSSLVNL